MGQGDGSLYRIERSVARGRRPRRCADLRDRRIVHQRPDADLPEHDARAAGRDTEAARRGCARRRNRLDNRTPGRERRACEPVGGEPTGAQRGSGQRGRGQARHSDPERLGLGHHRSRFSSAPAAALLHAAGALPVAEPPVRAKRTGASGRRRRRTGSQSALRDRWPAAVCTAGPQRRSAAQRDGPQGLARDDDVAPLSQSLSTLAGGSAHAAGVSGHCPAGPDGRPGHVAPEGRAGLSRYRYPPDAPAAEEVRPRRTEALRVRAVRAFAVDVRASHQRSGAGRLRARSGR